MEKYIIKGGNKLSGVVKVSGAKNVALKAAVAACLTSDEVTIHNVPLLSDFSIMTEIIKEFGGEVTFSEHTVKIRLESFKNSKISLDEASHTRTASMFIAPLLARNGLAIIPNPGGCRIGARPIDRTIEGLKLMGAQIDYKSEDGFFHATTHGDKRGARPIDRNATKRTYYATSDNLAARLHGVAYRFEKNTHTGTETMILAAVLATGKTVLENAAEEPEVDELIAMLVSMGADVKRTSARTIVIHGVERLHGTTFTIGPDRNEIVTFAVAAIATGGDIFVLGAKREGLVEFLEQLDIVGGGYEVKEDGIRFFSKGEIIASNVTTRQYPGFMTDWQAPWAILMTQAKGESTIHETVFESRFGYVAELQRMGARITFFNPEVKDPGSFYNFNSEDKGKYHAIHIKGPVHLHNAVVKITDLRAGATLVIAALTAQGESTIHGVHYVHRGYEAFDDRLRQLGAEISRVEEKT